MDLVTERTDEPRVRTESARAYAPSALPSVTARLLAFVAILIGGLCGGLIGYSVTELQCGGADTTVVIGAPPSARPSATTTSIAPTSDDGGCAAWNGAGGLIGAVIGAGGTGIVSVLVLRAMAEWRRDLDVDVAPD